MHCSVGPTSFSPWSSEVFFIFIIFCFFYNLKLFYIFFSELLIMTFFNSLFCWRCFLSIDAFDLSLNRKMNTFRTSAYKISRQEALTYAQKKNYIDKNLFMSPAVKNVLIIMDLLAIITYYLIIVLILFWHAFYVSPETAYIGLSEL